MAASNPDVQSALPKDLSGLSWLARVRRTTAFWMALAVFAMVIGFGVLSPNHVFWQYGNFVSMSLNATEALLLAMGMTFLLGAGELDLSVGANLVLSSVLAANTLVTVSGSPTEVANGLYPNLALGVIAAVAVALISGMAFGATNAILVTRLHVNSFIATLATTGIGTGIALVITNGIDVAYVPPALQSDFSGVKLLGLVPEPVMLPVVVIPILWYLLNRTRFGVHTQALGSSRLAATRAGIDAPRHVLKLFMLMGVMAALAGLVDVSRFGTTSVSAHTTDALAAIAACVIGGTSLYGGRASIGGSTIGTFIPVVLASGLIIVGVTSFYQLIAVGLILIVAVNIDQRRHTTST